MKSILIDQPAGIGDIIFCQKIAHYLSNTYKVFWPLSSDINWVSNYLDSPIIWENHKVDTVVNLRNSIYYREHKSVMLSKYDLLGLDWKDWKDFVKINRKVDKEKELRGLFPEKYCLVNRIYGTPPNSKIKDFSVITSLPIVDLCIIPGYTLFDWMKVIEDANEIYTVDTAINYLIEILNINAEKLELFSRFDNPNFSHVKDIFLKKWNWNE